MKRLLVAVLFTIVYNILSAVCDKCDGELFILRGINGLILSPNYGGLYEKNDYCRWRIEAPYGKRILIHFDSFDVEGDNQCGFDYLRLFDGYDAKARELGRFCGEFKPLDIISSSSSVYVTFKSDGTTERKGFKISYNIIDTVPQISGAILGASQTALARDRCSGQTIQVKVNDGEEATVVSPSYAEANYPPMDSCTWVISANRGQILRITFELFNMQDSAGCMADSLDIIDGPSDHHPSLVRLCGYQTPKPLLSSNNVVILKFSSNAYIEDEGFRLKISSEPAPTAPNLLNYQPPPNSASSNINNGAGLGASLNASVGLNPYNLNQRDRCNGKRTILTGVRGRVESPNYGNGFYFSNDFCTWQIEVPAPGRIRLSFEDFQLSKPKSGRCSTATGDLLTIYDGNSNKAPLLAQLCGTELPGNVVSTQNALVLEFLTDSSETLPGFSAFYTEIPADFVRINRSSLCQGRQKLITDATGYILSPNYGTQEYNPNDLCQWLIRQPAGVPIRIEFEDFELEDSTSCTSDRLSIYSGSGIHAPLAASYCGKGQPPPITIPGGSVFLRFETDPHVQSRGFKLRYSTTSASADVMCDADLTVSLKDEQVQGSSYWRNHYPYLALFTRVSANPDAPCCWSTGLNHEPGAFLQIDLGYERQITGFVTRGSPEDDEWVTSYYIATATSRPMIWSTLKNNNDNNEPFDRVFPGNRDAISNVVNRIWPPVRARYVRFLPRSQHRWMTAKFAVLGCQ